MPDYVMRGTRTLIEFAYVELKSAVNRERLASSLGIPVQHLSGKGKDDASYVSQRLSLARVSACAFLLGQPAANMVSFAGFEVVAP